MPVFWSYTRAYNTYIRTNIMCASCLSLVSFLSFYVITFLGICTNIRWCTFSCHKMLKIATFAFLLSFFLFIYLSVYVYINNCTQCTNLHCKSHSTSGEEKLLQQISVICTSALQYIYMNILPGPRWKQPRHVSQEYRNEYSRGISRFIFISIYI